VLLFETIEGRADLEVAGHLGINHCSQTTTNAEFLLILPKLVLNIEGICDVLIESEVPDSVEHSLDGLRAEGKQSSPRLIPERAIGEPSLDQHAAELIDQCAVRMVAATRLDS